MMATAFKRFCVIVDRSQVSKRWRALKDRSAAAVLAGKISSKRRRRSAFGSRVSNHPPVAGKLSVPHLGTGINGLGGALLVRNPDGKLSSVHL